MGFEVALADDLGGRTSLLADIQSATGNSLLILAAGAVGAAVDEASHLGLRMLVALCASGPIPFFRSILLQFQLLPGMIVAMILGMIVTIGIQSTVPAAGRGQRGHIGVAAAHIGCMAAMFSSIAICTSVLRTSGGFFRGVLAMLGTDSVVGISIAVVSVIVLRRIRPSGAWPVPV